MRLPFPDRIPLLYVACFSVVLFAIQIAEGTSPVFAIFSFIFIFLSAISFNLAGGLTTTSGVYVTAYSVLAVILGLCWKAILGEPADSNLSRPELTIKVYAASSAMMLLAVLASRRLTLKKPLLGNLVTDDNMQGATAGCLIAGLTLTLVLTFSFTGEESGSILSALAQVNRFLPLTIILGVIYEIRRSGGTRSINLAVLLAMAALTIQGLISFSKEGMFTAPLCWLLAAASQRYRLSRGQAMGLIIGCGLMAVYLVPYSQYGRTQHDQTLRGRVTTAIDLLGRLGEVRVLNHSIAEDQQQIYYYNSPQGFMDRLQMVYPDDGLISITEDRGPIGSWPLLFAVENLVPHFIWPDKPNIHFGNFYMHEMGGLADDDDTTGISFSPSGEAFHLARWVGVFTWPPLLWTILFVVFDSLCGDLRTSPWGLVVGVYFAHIAPEGMLQYVIRAVGFVAPTMVLTALVAAYLMPMLGALVSSPNRSSVRRLGVIQGTFRRQSPSLPQESIGQ